MDRRAAVRLMGAAGSAGGLGPAFGQSPFLAGQSPFLAGLGMPYEAFDALAKTRVTVDGGVISLAFAPGKLALDGVPILSWVERAALSVWTYYDRFPVASVRVLIVPVAGEGVRNGTTWGYGGAAIRMLLGQSAHLDDLDHDWKMTHEMVHLALPDLSRRHTWLAEGLAVYIEPIARVQAGYLDARTIWADMMRDMPRGLPVAGGGGLDNTFTWETIYWGGALFCLLADVGYRRATGNRRGLQDAMRGILAAGGNHEVEWPIGRILDLADQTAGAVVMRPLYESMRTEPVMTFLPGLWRDLGLQARPEGLALDDDAPLAPIRRAITAKPRAG
jgi:hypothetical protein